jgi:uncharacterized protein involved in exopolysaccharide biosynthesis
MSSGNSTLARADDIDLFAIVHVIWHHKGLISVITALFTALAIVFAMLAPHIYEAEVVVSEVGDRRGGLPPTIAGSLGGLASLTGLNLGATNESRRVRAVLSSRHVVEEFIKRRDLIPVLSSMEETAEAPSLWRAVKQFQDDVLSILEEPGRGVTTISIRWTDPVTAADWANDFVRVADEVIRKRALDDASRNIEFLNEQISKTNVVELQRVMYNLVETEYQTLMLANARSEYAFTVVDPAVPPEIRASPKRTVITLLGFAAGMFFGVLIAFIHHAWVQHKRSLALRP